MKKLLLTLLVLVVVSVAACNPSPATPTPETPAPTPAVPEPEATPTAEPTTVKPAAPSVPAWQWPEISIVTADASSIDKYLTWTNLLTADTGASIRIASEEATADRIQSVKDGEFMFTKVDKKKFRDILEAVEDSYGAYWAYPELGAFQVRAVWLHTLTNSGVYVRGDSAIESIYDIKPGTRWAVRSDTPYHRTIPKGILDWIGVAHEDIVFVNAGSYAGAAQAVATGDADVSWSVASSPELEVGLNSEYGLRYLDLDPRTDPEGVARFKAWDPHVTLLYTFGPIQNGVPPSLGHWGTKSWTFEITRAETDADLVYHLVKWLDENYARYRDGYEDNQFMNLDNLMEALEHDYLPAHDGLIRYLEEKGLWTAAHQQRQEQNIALLETYVQAYAAALAQAQAQGVQVVPDNPEWVYLWESYKWQHDIPRIQMFLGLEDTPAPIMVVEPVLPTAEAATADTGTVIFDTTPDGPRQPGDIFIELVSVSDPSHPDSDIEVVIRTLPGATCSIQPVNPKTGTLSSRPEDKVKIADDQGIVTWTWHAHRHVALGEGALRFTAEVEGQQVEKHYVWIVS